MPEGTQDSPKERCGGSGRIYPAGAAPDYPCPGCPDCTQDSSKVPEKPWPRVVLRRPFHGAADDIRSYSVLPVGHERPPEPGEREAETYIPVSALLSDEIVEAVARRRWNARREAIIQSGSAEGPGAAWDDIEPDPRNGHDARASDWNAARDFAADLQAAIEQVGGTNRA
jgi:hypothetical protein